MWNTTMKVTKTDPIRLAYLKKWRQSEKGKACVKRWLDIAAQKRKEKQALLPPKPPKPSREELLQKRREWQRAWRKTEAGMQSRKREFSSPQARLRKRIRRRLRSLVISAKVSDNNYELIGCTPAFLAKWLEGKFQDGMSWSNMGAWHIDHIVPCSAFDLSDKDQLLRCCHYTNLQPLWAKDNLAKSDLITAHTQEELPIKLTI